MIDKLGEVPFHRKVEAVSGVFHRCDDLGVVALEDVHSLDADEKISDHEASVTCRRTGNHCANLECGKRCSADDPQENQNQRWKLVAVSCA